MYKRQKVDLNDNKIIEVLKADEVNPSDLDIATEEFLEELNKGYENLSPGEKMVADAKMLSEAIEAIPETIKQTFIGGEYFNSLLKRLHSSNWNHLSVKERKNLFLEIHGYTHYVFGENLVNNQIMFSEKMVGEEYVYMEDGETYIWDKVFDTKNSGVSILSNYIYALTKNLILAIGDNMYRMEVDPWLLSPRALEYYENMQSSYLQDSWSNLLVKGEKYYYAQPLVHDSLELSKAIMIEHVKYLYKEFDYIDTEMSSLINSHMNEVNNQKELKKKRREAVMAARRNIKNSNKEVDEYYRYLEQSASVFSKLTDDEFYELFNMAYITALNSNEDGLLTVRMDNMFNELPRRVFKDFDLTKIELPKYKTEIDTENQALNLVRIYEGKTSSQSIVSSGAGLSVVLGDLIMLCQKHVLFKFSSEKEYTDYMTMKEWVDLKNHDYSDPTDNEIVKDGLNIILRKTNEMISDLNTKIKLAISKSKYIPHGKSMISHDNKDALYDYHEFKNLYTKDEITENLMEYIRLDIEEMKRNRNNNTGGRK